MIYNPTCTDCDLCNTRNLVVAGQGPMPCSLMMVAEAPGEVEDQKGTPFHKDAQAGAELNNVLFANRFDRSNAFLSNIVKCRPPNNRDPKKAEIDACSKYLDAEVEAVDPRILATIGRYSTRYFLGDVDMETVHGIPFDVDGRIIVPMYHIAAGLRDNRMMLNVYADFEVLFGILRRERPARHIEDPFEGLEQYNQCRTAYDVISAIGDSDVVAVDVEWSTDHVLWCITFSVAPGTSNLIMLEDREAIAALAMYMSNPEMTSVIHNTLSDLTVLASVGIHPAHPVDTMVMAYLLQNEPQGLKPLAFRHCGMKMGSYSETVAPATFYNAIEYLHRVQEKEWPNPPQIMEWKGGVPKFRQPQNINRKVKSIFTDMASGKKGDVDPRERWMKFSPEERAMVEAELGEMKEGDLGDVDPEKAIQYSSSDADATIRIYPILKTRIDDLELTPTFERDMRAIPMVNDMMETGVLIDPDHFVNFAAYLQSKEDELQSQISDIAGWSVNPGSPIQMQKLLFEQLKLPTYKKTDTGYSTDEKVLARLVDKHPVIQLIRDYRSYNKLRTSYAEVMPVIMDKNHRVHSTLRITRVETGRLSSSKPNLMAQPVRSSEGRRLKEGYIAEDGCSLVEIDYSQADMRCAAHGSGDEKMISVFVNGGDIHSETASGMFKLPIDQLDEMRHRYPAKRVGFGVLNEISPQGLQRELIAGGAKEDDWPVWLCKKLIDSWFDVYPGVGLYTSRTKAEARRYGYIRDMWGRRRYVPGIRSSSRMARAEAERQAVNAPFQMGTAGIVKEAMGQLTPVYRGYRLAGYTCNPLIQVHDSLLFEVQDDILSEFISLARSIMEGVAPFMLVPLLTDAKCGKNWGSAEKWKGGM